MKQDEYRAAKREASRLGISIAELMRRSLRSVLPTDSDKPWMKYAGMVETGDTTSSSTVDEIVNGQKP